MRVQFISPLDARRLDSGRWRLLGDLRAISSDEAGARSWRVPAGHETDFASVPRLPFMFWIFGDTAHRAAVLHDYLYAGGLDNAGEGVTRAQADAIFSAGMKADNVSAWRRGPMWLGVRLFGGGRFGAGEAGE